MNNQQNEKLARYLARCGIGSRRTCEEYIKAGWVRVNEEVITRPAERINPADCRVYLRGKEVKPTEELRYILLNKPRGMLCTVKPSKEKGRSILDIVQVPQRIFNVGRLDKDSSGLLLLTNDGALMQRLTHPSFGKEKEYIVATANEITVNHMRLLKDGVELDDGLSKFKHIRRISKRRLSVIMTEGRKRQIRRTLQAVSLKIDSLHRIRLGSLELGRLKSGEWRDLTQLEIDSIKSTQEVK